MKRRLALARRGHKLLKDKEEQLLMEFRRLLSEVRRQREEIEKSFLQFTAEMLSVRGRMTSDQWERLLILPAVEVRFSVTREKVFNVPVRRLIFTAEKKPVFLPPEDPGFAVLLKEGLSLLERLILLANLESHLLAFATEIERTRRRVNALEYILIPNVEESIKFITFKLAETERASLVRLKHIRWA